jgi:phosphatidylinositol alpha-1,6-mannosyltransferase
MKVLYLTPGCFDKGGISRYSRYQIRALRDLYGENAVRVLSLLGPDGDAFEEEFPVQWHGAGAGAASKARLVLQFAAQCAAWRPSVVHVAHVNFSGLARVVARLAGAVTVLNTYGLEVWSGLRTDAFWGLRGCDVVLSDCHATAGYIEGKGWRPAGMPVIWDCVDLERFRPGNCPPAVRARYGLPEDGLIVMTLGRLGSQAAHKGYDRLLEAFSRMSGRVPEAVLVVAGRGAMRPMLEAKAAALGIADRTVFTGPVNEADLPDLYRAASVFSLVSDCGMGRGEGIPLTPLESMACGTPVLVGNQDGSREAVVDGRNGVVLDPFDLDAHADVLERLLRDKELRHRQSTEAVRVAHECFSYEGFLQKHKNLYSTMHVK